MMWLLSIALCATVQLAVVTGSKRSFQGYALYHLYPDNAEKLRYLQTLYEKSDDADNDQLDFWHPPAALDEPTEVFVSPASKNNFADNLKKHQIQFNVSEHNIQEAMEEEKKTDGKHHRRRMFSENEAEFDLLTYNSFTNIEAYLRHLASTMPGLIRVQSLGKTHENRTLLMIQLGRNANPKNPGIWIDGGIHAREWISPATVLYMIDAIIDGYNENDTTIRRYMDEMTWYILPVMNPDGYAYTHTKDRMWRKNRSPEACVGRRCCQGVDLNRNFGYYWGASGASKNPCSNTYRGTKAFSEPETMAVRDFIMQNNKQIKAFLSFHSYGQYWMYPYGFKKRVYPKDMEDLRVLSVKAVESLRAVNGGKFKVGSAANVLYTASGASEDWAKGVAGIKYAYCVELRPSGIGNGFVLAPRHILPSGKEIWASVRVVADTVLEKYGPYSTATPPTEEPEEAEVGEEEESSASPRSVVNSSGDDDDDGKDE